MITNNSLWHGVVEDIHDPLKLGRVRVRIYGLHDPRISFAEGTIGLTTSDLPWAHVLTHGAAMNGIGFSPSFIVQGTWVTGYFRDAFKQEPIVTGALNGFAQAANPNYPDTFRDPQRIYPLQDHLNEQDVNRLARNDFDDSPANELNAGSPLVEEQHSLSVFENTTHNKLARHKVLINKAADRTLGVRQVSGSSWDEPYQSYSATYPNNLVMETTAGHIKEYDSTPSAERIHEYHKAGTFYEIQPDGSKITKIVGSDYEIVVEDKNVLISGNLNVTIIGNSNLVVQGNVTQEIDGNVDQTIGGNITQNVGGNIDQTVGGSVTQTIAGDLTSTSANITLNSAGETAITTGGNTSIITGGIMTINGSLINIG